MVAVKAAQVTGFLKSPPRGTTAVLFFGPDSGLVAERAGQLATLLSKQSKPEGEIVRIEDPDLEQEPDKLDIELETMPMFGGPKIIRTSASRRVTAASLKPLIEAGRMTGHLIVEAGNLRPDEGLRALFEKSPIAAAIPCYPDEAQDLQGLVDQVIAASGMKISDDARRALVSRLGADRGLSRGEIEKLCIYAAGQPQIEIEHIEAIVGDAMAQTVDRILSAACTGNGALAAIELDRAVLAGESPQMVILAVQRHLHRLHRMRTGLDTGKSFDELVRGIRPPLHFRAKDALASEVRTWTTAKLSTALQRSAEVARLARLNSALDATFAERLLLELASLVKPPDQARTNLPRG